MAISMTINGETNNAEHIPIRFTSSTVLVGGSGAAVSVSAQTGSLIQSITISAPGFNFNSIQFNPQGLTGNGILMVSALMDNGQTFDCPGPACTLTTYSSTSGHNRLAITTGSGELIHSVTISSIGAGTGFVHLDHVRFDGSPSGFEPEPVPEPSALEGLLLGTGMLGLAEMTRRKLKLGT